MTGGPRRGRPMSKPRGHFEAGRLPQPRLKMANPVDNPSLIRRQSGVAKASRSAVTNGRRLHVVRPGDTAWARRFRDVLAEIVSDLGGADGLSEARRDHGTGYRFSVTLLRRHTVYLPASVDRNRNRDALRGIHPATG